MSLNGVSGGEILFGPFRLEPQRRALYRGDVLIPLGARALDVLCVLAASPGKLVTKDDLMAQVWPGVIVEENNIQVQVWALRKALGKDRDGQDYVITVPGRGYRFAAEVAPQSSSAMPGPQAGARPSIAVLPFTNLTDEPRYASFADGLVEEVTTELAKLRWVHVIARKSSFAYTGRAVDVREIGHALGAQYVVDGSIRASEGRVRVTAQLVEAETRAHIWAGNFNRALADVLALQDEISRGIIAAVEPSIRSTEIAWAIRGAGASVNAYVLYLRALPDIYVRRPPNLARAESLLRRAIELDPDYADALAALADCLLLQAIEGSVRADRLTAARADAIAFARRAVAVDPMNCRALSVAAFALGAMYHRFEEGLELAQQAVMLNPGSAAVHNSCGQVFIALGEPDKALACFEEARRLSPFHGTWLMQNGGPTIGATMGHVFAGRFEDAVKWGRRAIADEPEKGSPRRFVAAALGHLGRGEEARTEICEILRLQPMSSLARSRQISIQPAWAREIYVDGLEAAGLPEF
jgi:adenylate cyclase